MPRPVQIDNPYVDWRSNALTRIKEAYRGFGPQVAQVRFEHNYRAHLDEGGRTLISFEC